MAQRHEFYKTPEERQALAEAGIAIGERILNDTHGVGPNGENQLTFIPDPPHVPTRLDELRGRTRNGTMSLQEHLEMHRLESGE